MPSKKISAAARKTRGRALHPVQPLIVCKDGIVRFKPNKIVQYLLDAGFTDMNVLSLTPFPDEDREQFAQLIGYSLSGFSDLSYVSEKTFQWAAAQEVHGKQAAR